MPNFSNKPIKNKLPAFTRVSPYEIPKYYRNIYFQCLNLFIDYDRKLISSIFNRVEGGLKFPITYRYIEDYLTGYRFVYIPFNKREVDINTLAGFYQVDNDTVYIFYDQDLSQERIRFTIAHEIFHFCQSIDPYFKKLIDYLIQNNILNLNVIYTLLEKATDKAAAAYLMPSKHFYKKYQETQDIYEVSNYFKVSVETATYRLKECGQFI